MGKRDKNREKPAARHRMPRNFVPALVRDRRRWYHAILLQLGITPNYKGYHQMLTALEIVEANPEALTMVTKWLYPAVAKRHQTNWKQVERNLRIAVRTAWGTNRDFLQKLSPLPVKKRPTVSQFISILWKTDT